MGATRTGGRAQCEPESQRPWAGIGGAKLAACRRLHEGMLRCRLRRAPRRRGRRLLQQLGHHLALAAAQNVYRHKRIPDVASTACEQPWQVSGRPLSDLQAITRTTLQREPTHSQPTQSQPLLLTSSVGQN